MFFTLHYAFFYAEINALMHLSCIYKGKKWLACSSEWMEVCFLKQKLNREGKYFLPSWELLICQMWVL